MVAIERPSSSIDKDERISKRRDSIVKLKGVLGRLGAARSNIDLLVI